MSSTSKFQASLAKGWDKTKKKAAETKKNFDQRMTMEGLLTQARISLEQYLDPKVIPAEERMSREILAKARGIALISEAKGGFIVGIKGGTGIIMVKKQTHGQKKNKKAAAQWTSPCAVGTGGISLGFLAGASKVDHIVVLSSQEQVDMFLSNGQLQIKGNTNATAGKWGRNADAGVGVGSNKQANTDKQTVAPIFTYSFGVKGIYAGVSLDGDVLSVRKDCNEAFYQATVHVKDILTGAVKMPKKNKDYVKITQLLSDYCVGANDDDEKQQGQGFGMDFPVQPQQGPPQHPHHPPPQPHPQGMVKPMHPQYAQQPPMQARPYQQPQAMAQPQYAQHNYNNNNNMQMNQTDAAAMQAIAQNQQVHQAGRSAMHDPNIRNAAFNAYKGGGNDPNANKQLAKSMAQNKAVQGAAVSVAKDKNVQKAAYQHGKKHATQQFQKMMAPKQQNNNVPPDNYV
eukprot:CAMPEP_0197027114 /NCGR_PEP_ID=MMETSP1384-20130603/7084_1 /TAXON_ID=29189 /ORGANISM="Ammonia sp." /LENGTH=455 /DNA_ID=CAMNT_0042455913 /DNA_START=30 /DNA_END=1397 /DNA_ORIENTATION=+